MKTLIQLVAFLLATTAIAPSSLAQSTPEPPTLQDSAQALVETTIVTKTDYRYLVYKPDDYAQQDKHPLLLFLHGAGERGNDIDKVKIHGPPMMIEQGQSLPFIVISPQCPAGKWWNPIELEGLLDHVEKTYKVDPDRIYVTGLSMGGYGTWALAIRNSDRFAAIAPVCGGGDRMAARYIRAIKVPTWAFHGAKDKVVPLIESTSMIDILKEQGVEAKLTVYPEVGHDSWVKAYQTQELYDWMLAHKRSDRTPKTPEK